MFDYASLERRVAALEARFPASLRFGRVTGVEGGAARVQLDDGQGVVTMPLPTLQRRVLKDQEIKMPDVGEPVAALFSGQAGGQETGVVLGAVYSPAVPDPEQPAHFEYSRFSDGTVIHYDRETHKLFADVKGDVEVKTTGAVSIEAEGEITAQSAVRIKLKAPFIELAGLLVWTDEDGNAGHGVLRGTVVVRDGSVHVPDEDVTAGAVSVRGHVHEDVWTGPDTTGKPVGG
ncbi:MAG: phage baseplate assembly protein V [Desulfovibrio sp.]|jgi:phage baseplate assembly protein V|nr:phage baseplate assembly protein V [Desulfovibrio sp.]